MRLPDGRELAWCEYGVPDGQPVIYCHGIPGSRIDWRAISGAAEKTGVRLITPDRPGFGRSTPERQPRTYAGWARDLARLADEVGVERFGIVAYSAGAPYALAAAASLGGRVSRLALVSGVAPSEMPNHVKGTGPTDQVMLRLVPRAPWLARALVKMTIKGTVKNPDRSGRQLNRDFSAPADRELLDSNDYRRFFVEVFLEATRNGPAGIVEDFAVWARPSQLTLSEIDTPAKLWHGADDRTMPSTHSRWIASQLPAAELTEWPEVGHLHPEERWTEVLSTLA
jgi:pimeloyl-ACP methyl ester carboxylesterase